MTPSSRLWSDRRRMVWGTRLERPTVRFAAWLRAVIARSPDATTVPSLPVEPAPSAEPPPAAPMFVEPGHFFSPIPSLADIDAQRRSTVTYPPDSLPEIDLRLDEQRALLEQLRPFYAD